jgi:hypothetical protein
MMKHCTVIIHIEKTFWFRGWVHCLFTLSYFTKPHYTVGLTFSEKKIISRNTELTKLLIHSEGIPPVWKTLGIPFRAIPGKKKIFEFRSEPFRRRETEKHSELRKFVPSHSAVFFSSRNSVLFSFVPNFEMGCSETHGIPRKKHFFRGITKIVLSLFRRIFSERNFDGHPTPLTCLVFRSYFDVLCWRHRSH